MKILLTVELYCPHKGGAERVVEEIAVGLASRGHDVTVATTYLPERKERALRGVTIEEFRISGNAATGIKGKQSEIKRYENLLLSGGFDVIFNYAAQNWPTDLALPLLTRIPSKKVIAPVGYSRLHSLRYRRYFNILPAYLARYNALVYHSPNYQDKRYGDENGLTEKAVIIPNGASEDEFLGSTEQFAQGKEAFALGTPYMLLAVAHHNVAKGHRFVIQAFRKMHRSDATLVLIGDRFVSYGLRRIAHFILDYLYCLISSMFVKNIRLVSAGRDTVVAAYRVADICLSGSKLECAPLIMYEAFAAGVPFVSTDVGNVSDHKEVVKIVHTPDEMAKEVSYLLDHPHERAKLGERAHQMWGKAHTWKGIVSQYEKLFEDIHHGRFPGL